MLSKIDLEKLYEYSMGGEERYLNSDIDIKKEGIKFAKLSAKYDLDNMYALWALPNGINYHKKYIKALNLNSNDIVLDLGCGDGTSSITMIREYNAKKVWGIEMSESWYQETLDWLKNNYKIHILELAYNNFLYINKPWQEFEFPKEITKCLFLAWHNGRKTLKGIMDKLKKTNCELFICNFFNHNML